jgi:hypothetical protein
MIACESCSKKGNAFCALNNSPDKFLLNVNCQQNEPKLIERELIKTLNACVVALVGLSGARRARPCLPVANPMLTVPAGLQSV